MKEKLLNILVCPHCLGEFLCQKKQVIGEEIISGQLSCNVCNKQYPIINAIPRFVPLENYSESFGFQWNKFKHTQIDCFSKTQSSCLRFESETSWNPEKLGENEWILDGGCGNGRFIDIASRGRSEVVGVDLSYAVDAASELFKDRKNVHLVQASLLQLPFRSGAFDNAYCIGVIQHTPDPEKVIRELPRVVKKTGKLAVTIYEKRKFTLLNGKYFFRHLTKKMNQKVLLLLIQCIAPILFPLTEVLYRIPLLGKLCQFLIPFANYVHDPQLNWRKRYKMAILDTFDALSPVYDLPQTQSDVTKYLKEAGMVDIERTSCSGLNLIATKAG